MNPDLPILEEADRASYPLLREVVRCIETAQALPNLPKEPLRELREKIDSHAFNLVVMGEFKRGKSSVINALIGANLLPVGVIPVTAIATVLCYGEQTAVEVIFQSGEHRYIILESLWDYVTEKGNPRNEKNVREVRIAYPSAWLKSGVRMVDTPGIGSVYQHNTEVTYQLLPKVDAVLFLLSVEQSIGQAEYDFLKQVGEYAGKIFFLLNKADMLTDSDLAESVEFTSQVIAKAIGRSVPVFPVSARLALEGQEKHSDELLAKSHFPEFSAALSLFLMEEKGNVMVASAARKLLRLISQTRFTAELALKSLRTPADELHRKIEAFEIKRREILEIRKDFAVLLEITSKRLADKTVTEDVESFKNHFFTELKQSIHDKFGEIRTSPSKELHVALERFVIDQVRAAYDSFREREDDKIEAVFDSFCSRSTTKINDVVDELFRFSSELFTIPFDTVRAESVWNIQSHFYYKFWNEPSNLKTITSSFVLALPKFLGDSLILKEAVKYGYEMADTQAGRVRYDFAQRLDKSMRNFRIAMLGRIDATLESIETAIKKGTEINEVDAQVADTRAAELNIQLEALGSLADSLDDIRQQVGG